MSCSRLQEGGSGGLSELREDCLAALDSPTHVTAIVGLTSEADPTTLYPVAVICHCLMAQHGYSIHRRKYVFVGLNYVDAFLYDVVLDYFLYGVVLHACDLK